MIRSGSALAVLAVIGLGACVAWSCGGPSSDTAEVAATIEPPAPDTSEMEEPVARRLEETRAAVLADPGSASAWGRFGMVCHAHELRAEAADSYRQAEKLNPEDERWPYYLGDVLSVLGDDPAAAEGAFRRAMKQRPDYAPAHMRLGNVLVAANRHEEAARELERALELAPDLQPAQVSLAQARLSLGHLERAAELLEGVLAEAPRHGRALSTLSQVYQRLGRREEAREIAARARDAASYNLYADPLMGQVVAEEVSSVQIWERAKSFLENGNYEQAAIGLGTVVERQPDNAEALLQLAVAYGHLGRPDRARPLLERVVSLDPDNVDPRVRLAGLYLDSQEPALAVQELEQALALDPGHAQAGWLLGKARAQVGDLQGAVQAFDETQAKGHAAPGWAHTHWGKALAETGRPGPALEHFMTAAELDPGDAQAWFYSGLVLEGTGRLEDAVKAYCRSLAAQPNPPAAERLQGLNRRCG